jgi:hypothetical protein
VKKLRREISDNQSGFLVYQIPGSELFIAENCESSYIRKIKNALAEYHEKNPILPQGLESSELLGKLGLTNIKTGKIYLELLLEKLKSHRNH